MSDEVVSNDLAEKREKFAHKQSEMASILKLAGEGTDVFNLSRPAVLKKLGANDTNDAAEKLRELDSELQSLGTELRNAEMKALRDRNRQREELRGEPAEDYQRPHEVSRKSFGQLFTSTKSFIEGQKSRTPSSAIVDISLKTLMETTAGYAPDSVRSGVVVAAATEPVQLLQYIPVRSTQYELVKYMEETSTTPPTAEERAEGTAYAEAEFEFTERESPVRKITTSLPITDEQLQDAPEVAAIIDSRLRFGIMKRLDTQIMVGNGTPPNLAGLLDYTGAGHANGDIQTLAQGVGGIGDSIFDAVFSAMMLVRTTGRANPNLIVLHPTDFGIVRLAKTELGEYIMGNPGQGGGSTTLFGLPVALVESLTPGTGVVGDFANFCYIAERRGIDVQAGYVGDQFKEGKKTIRADLRAAFVVLRPGAFVSMTSLAAPA